MGIYERHCINNKARRRFAKVTFTTSEVDVPVQKDIAPFLKSSVPCMHRITPKLYLRQTWLGFGLSAGLDATLAFRMGPLKAFTLPIAPYVCIRCGISRGHGKTLGSRSYQMKVPGLSSP